MKKILLVMLFIILCLNIFSQEKEYKNEAGIITHSKFRTSLVSKDVELNYFNSEKNYSQGIGFYYNYYFNKKLSLDICPSYNRFKIENESNWIVKTAEIHIPIKLSYYYNPKDKIIVYSSFGINNDILLRSVGYNIFFGSKYNFHKQFIFDCSIAMWLNNFRSKHNRYKELMLNFSVGYKF